MRDVCMFVWWTSCRSSYAQSWTQFSTPAWSSFAVALTDSRHLKGSKGQLCRIGWPPIVSFIFSFCVWKICIMIVSRLNHVTITVMAETGSLASRVCSLLFSVVYRDPTELVRPLSEQRPHAIPVSFSHTIVNSDTKSIHNIPSWTLAKLKSFL
jgi:hypothetical protein